MEKIGSLNSLDYLIFILYFSVLIYMSWRLSKGQVSEADYFVGGTMNKNEGKGVKPKVQKIYGLSFINENNGRRCCPKFKEFAR
ncbi:MAG: hypothetical protein KAU06_05315 [Candidatus Marinimicrobia bacterium]|nr:hypothetical protein [Candidatus Neomarinimicrobiota bacterium]